MSELTKRYAVGLYSLVESEKDYLSYKDEAEALITIFSENQDYSRALQSAFLSKEEKIELINETLGGFHPYMISFISVICDNHRIDNVEEILYDFISLINEKIGVKEGLIYSAEPLTGDEIKEVEMSISKKEKRKVELKNVIDNTLIGGVKVLIGDKVYDGTIKNKLENLKLNLLRGGN
ncbi:MAG: F0F1 ATP synthase subunit delta [Coprobacillus sp.]|nr:F0F1 ATP synthase subunit delta [Coprobacillus sp.]